MGYLPTDELLRRQRDPMKYPVPVIEHSTSPPQPLEQGAEHRPASPAMLQSLGHRPGCLPGRVIGHTGAQELVADAAAG